MGRVWGIVGSGAVGGYFGFRLLEAGRKVRYLARGATLEALRSRGLRVTTGGRTHCREVEADDDPNLLAGCATVLIAVKNTDLETALSAVRQGMDSEAFAVTLQNGVGAPYDAQRVLGGERIVAGIAYLGAERTAPAEIVHTGLGHLTVGEIGGGSSARCSALATELKEAGIPARASAEIESEMWRKLAWNAAFNGPTALSSCSPAELTREPEGRALCQALIGEVVEAARCRGVTLGPEVARQQIELSEGLTELRTSMLQDLEAGRAPETEALYLRTLGVLRQAGRHAPAHQAVAALLLAAEKGVKESRSRGSTAASRRSRPGTVDNR